jgi:hypothetical protein
MPSPFAGMDPYLEDGKLWPSFQHQMVHSLYQMLLPGLMDRYRARVCQRIYVAEQALFTSIIREEHQESLIEIRQRADGRLITIVDAAGPANKTTSEGRAAYLEKRREGQSCQCNLVEIDLVLQGAPLLDYSREGLPDWDFAVTVTRASKPDQYEIYTATLEKPLPRFRLPLAADDRDTVVDLQAAFNRAFDQGNFLEKIDYRHDPATKLDDADRAYVDQRLRRQKMRE